MLRVCKDSAVFSILHSFIRLITSAKTSTGQNHKNDIDMVSKTIERCYP